MTYEELLTDVERWIERLDASAGRIEAMIKRAELLLAPTFVVSAGSISGAGAGGAGAGAGAGAGGAGAGAAGGVVEQGGSISSIDLDQRINIKQFLRLLPPHKGELSIEHNPHRSYYVTVAEHLENIDEDASEWASPAERDAAITSGELWVVQWYPDTPIGSYRVYGSSLEACLRKIRETDYT